MKFPIEIEGVSAVLVGSMNPAIFHPAWFEEHGLISEAEAASSSVEIIHQEISIVSVASARIEVRKDRFVAHAGPGESLYLRDLVPQIFKLLAHTPVTALGMNRNMHMRCASRDVVNSIGRALAPQDLWQDMLDVTGMRTLTMEGKRGANGGRYQVTIEPSNKVDNGVYVGVNVHHDVDGSAAAAMQVLESEWDEVQLWSRKASLDLIERASSS